MELGKREYRDEDPIVWFYVESKIRSDWASILLQRFSAVVGILFIYPVLVFEPLFYL